MGIEEIISQRFVWCFWASQTLYNGRTLEPELQTQLEYFWITLTWQAVCTVQLINTWRKAGLSRGFVDYYENEEHTDNRHTDTHTGVHIESVPD